MAAGDPVTVTIPAGTYSSTESQDDADMHALAAAIEQANAALDCTPPIPEFCGDTPINVQDLSWISETGSEGSTVMTGGNGTFTFNSTLGTGGYDTETSICNPCDTTYDITVTITATATSSDPSPSLFTPVMRFNLLINGVTVDGASIGDPGETGGSGTVVLTGTLPAAAIATVYLDIGLLRLAGTMSGTIAVTPLTVPC